MNGGPTTRLAEHIASLSYDALGDEAVGRAKQVIADSLACGLAGSVIAEQTIAPLIAYGELLDAHGRCSVVATGGRTSQPVAALMNATTIHTIDYDDTHMEVVSHFGASVVASALAAVEARGGSGADLITAVAAGYEMGGKVGRAVMPDHYQRWHATSSLGGIAAAAATARAMSLDRLGTEIAVGFAADDAGGTRYCIMEGDFTKSLHAGTAAWKGSQAALLASVGAAGPTGFLEHRLGFVWAYTDERDVDRLAAVAEDLDAGEWEILKADIKAHPCILSSHTAIEGATAIAAEHGLGLEEITGIVLRQPAYSERHGLNYRPDTVMGARMSVPFCVVIGLLEGEVGLRQFTERSFRDPALHAHMDKVTIHPDPELRTRYPGSAPTRVEMVTVDGARYEREVGYARGSHRRPMTADRFEAKQRELLGYRFGSGTIDRWLETMDGIEAAANLGELGGLIQMAASGRGR
jgi:2-methylcitrate dehydratase PrpD